jgi:hypothetical protein
MRPRHTRVARQIAKDDASGLERFGGERRVAPGRGEQLTSGETRAACAVDEHDRLVLILQANGREPCAQLFRRLGLGASAQHLWNRRHQLRTGDGNRGVAEPFSPPRRYLLRLGVGDLLDLPAQIDIELASQGGIRAASDDGNRRDERQEYGKMDARPRSRGRRVPANHGRSARPSTCGTYWLGAAKVSSEKLA